MATHFEENRIALYIASAMSIQADRYYFQRGLGTHKTGNAG